MSIVSIKYMWEQNKVVYIYDLVSLIKNAESFN